MKRHSIFKLFIDFEQEEKWINKMAARGLHFIHCTPPGQYLFEEGTPGEYIYRMELLDSMPNNPESKVYLKFMEESGAEVVDTYVRWVYFRKKAAEGPFEVYSDNSSKIAHYKRIALLFGIIGGANLFNGFLNLYNWLRTDLTLLIYVMMGCFAVGTALSYLAVKYLLQIRKLHKVTQVFE